MEVEQETQKSDRWNNIEQAPSRGSPHATGFAGSSLTGTLFCGASGAGFPACRLPAGRQGRQARATPQAVCEDAASVSWWSFTLRFCKPNFPFYRPAEPALVPGSSLHVLFPDAWVKAAIALSGRGRK